MSGASDAEVFDYLQNATYDTLEDFCDAADVNFQLTTGSEYFQQDYCDANGNLNDIAKQYTYLVGSVWSESVTRNSADAVAGDAASGGSKPGDAKCNISAAEQDTRMREYLGSKYDSAKAAFAKAYPTHDLYSLGSLTSYAGGRMATNTAGSGAKVYEYIVAYEMPYFGGMAMNHTADLGFWFHSIDSIGYQIAGDEAVAHDVADAMASALAAFCATGDPSTRKLAWDPYTTERPRTMIFDVKSQCKDSSFDDELQQIMQG